MKNTNEDLRTLYNTVYLRTLHNGYSAMIANIRAQQAVEQYVKEGTQTI